MSNPDPAPTQRLRGSLAVLGVALLALVFLVAIERPHWFSLRPVSGAATAMSHAGSAPPARP